MSYNATFNRMMALNRIQMNLSRKNKEHASDIRFQLNLPQPLPKGTYTESIPDSIPEFKSSDAQNIEELRFAMEREAISEDRNGAQGEDLRLKYGAPIAPAYATRLNSLANQLKYECTAFFSEKAEGPTFAKISKLMICSLALFSDYTKG
jgi:hypothetical protein